MNSYRSRSAFSKCLNFLCNSLNCLVILLYSDVKFLLSVLKFLSAFQNK